MAGGGGGDGGQVRCGPAELYQVRQAMNVTRQKAPPGHGPRSKTAAIFQAFRNHLYNNHKFWLTF